MTTPAKTPGSPSSPSSSDPSVTVAASDAVEGPKKRKKKYGRGPLKYGQKGEVTVTKSVHRLARAVEAGLGTWRSKRNSSNDKKKNGGLRDALENAGSAVTKFQKIAAKIPEDLTKSLPKLRLFR
jgi:hypothetical protein